MQKELDNSGSMHLTAEVWQQVCEFFHHDAARRAPQYCVSVPKFARELLPVQALTVWHSLQMLNGLAGTVFIGHVMGIGKTTASYATHHVQHQINRMYEHIHQSPELH